MSFDGLSASGGDRAQLCPPSCALHAEKDEGTVHSERGTAIHAYLADLASGIPRDEALARVAPEYRDACSWINPDDVPRGLVEIAYIYDVATDTARCLGRIEHRKYPRCEPSEIPCTIDLVYSDDGGHDTVRDWKTGHERPGNPATAMQLALNALAVSRCGGTVDAVEFAIVGNDGGIDIARHDIDDWQLDAWADAWRETWERVQEARAVVARGEMPMVNPGDAQCQYCRCKPSCPAYATDARALAVPLPANWLGTFRAEIESDESAATWWTKIARMREILDAFESALKERAALRPFALADGQVVSERTSSRDKVVRPDVAYRVLVDTCGAAVADATCPAMRETTKGAIEKAVKAAGGDVKLVLRMMRESKAIESKESKTVEARRT